MTTDTANAQLPLMLPPTEHKCTYEAGGTKAIKDESTRMESALMVDPHKIVVDPNYNVRIRTQSYLQWVRELANNMLEAGFDPGNPLTVISVKQDDQDVLMVRAGNTRLEAALLAIKEGAEFTKIPVILRPKTDSPKDQTVNLVRSNNGRALTSAEYAIVVKRLYNMGLTEAQISRDLDIVPSYVNGLLLLSSAPHKLTLHVAEERVSGAVAIDLMRKHGGEKALAVIEESLARAQAAGKTKATPAHLPNAHYNRVIKAKSPDLVRIAARIYNDPSFAQLSKTIQDDLRVLLEALEEAKPKDAPAASTPAAADTVAATGPAPQAAAPAPKTDATPKANPKPAAAPSSKVPAKTASKSNPKPAQKSKTAAKSVSKSAQKPKPAAKPKPKPKPTPKPKPKPKPASKPKSKSTPKPKSKKAGGASTSAVSANPKTTPAVASKAEPKVAAAAAPTTAAAAPTASLNPMTTPAAAPLTAAAASAAAAAAPGPMAAI